MYSLWKVICRQVFFKKSYENPRSYNCFKSNQESNPLLSLSSKFQEQEWSEASWEDIHTCVKSYKTIQLLALIVTKALGVLHIQSNILWLTTFSLLQVWSAAVSGAGDHQAGGGGPDQQDQQRPGGAVHQGAGAGLHSWGRLGVRGWRPHLRPLLHPRLRSHDSQGHPALRHVSGVTSLYQDGAPGCLPAHLCWEPVHPAQVWWHCGGWWGSQMFRISQCSGQDSRPTIYCLTLNKIQSRTTTPTIDDGPVGLVSGHSHAPASRQTEVQVRADPGVGGTDTEDSREESSLGGGRSDGVTTAHEVWSPEPHSLNKNWR